MSIDRLFRVAFWSAAAIALVAASLPQPPQLPGDPSDKVQHIVAFVCLAALGARAYPAVSALRLALGLSLFGALIEVVQLIPALHRDSDVLDWEADTLAAVTVLVAIHAWRWIRRRRTTAADPEPTIQP